MTFTKSDILEKLEDGSRQRRRLPQLGLIYQAGQSPGEVVPIMSEESPEQAREISRQS